MSFLQKMQTMSGQMFADLAEACETAVDIWLDRSFFGEGVANTFSGWAEVESWLSSFSVETAEAWFCQ